MGITKIFLLIIFIFNFSKEISSNDFNYIEPNKILKGSTIDFRIEFNEGIERWDNSTSIKIGDNNIPLENCHRERNKDDKDDGTGSYVIYIIRCNNILLDGDNTEISYGGVVQTGPNLNISFYDEFSVESIDNINLIKDSNEYFYIKTDIVININKYTVKLGNYVVNCSYSHQYYYSSCDVKIEKEGSYTLTIDGKEIKLDEGTENERIASITIYEYKITELPTFSVDSIEASESLSFSLKMLHNEIADRISFHIGNYYFSCSSDSNDEQNNNVICWATLNLKNKAKEKETQYLYYYDPIEQTDIKTNISIVVTAPKTLKIKWYSVNNYRYSDRIYKDVKSTINFYTNLNYLFDKNKDKIKIGNNELFQCNRFRKYLLLWNIH